MKKFKGTYIIFGLALIAVLGSLFTAVYFYRQYQNLKKNPDSVAKAEVKQVTQAISKFMDLPANEEPSLATITDEVKLKEQDFFKNSKNGDKVLIYAQARKAILYRPSVNRIIEFAPLLINPASASASAPSEVAAPSPVSVAIYNGTNEVGLTNDVEKKIADKSLKVVTKTNAAKDTYTKSMIIDLSGNNAQLAQLLATKINGEVVTQLPDGETKPTTDILIIAGK
jgi:hypothetical protein